MTLYQRFDAWAARRLFQPPTIKMCQTFHWTQYQFSRYLNMLFWIWMAGHAQWTLLDYFILIPNLLISILNVAIQSPETPIEPQNWVRALGWGLLVFVLAFFAVFDDTPLYIVFAIPILLFAEYAKTIDTIPPQEDNAREKFNKTADQTS